MMRRALLAAAAGLLALPQAAAAQDPAESPAADVVREHQAVVAVAGALEVTFAADPATCAAAGRCGTTGTLAWSPPESGTLSLATVALNGRRGTRASLSAAASPGDVHAVVRRPRPGGGTAVCSDVRTPENPLQAAAEGRALLVGLHEHSDVLATRCGGPLWRDVAAVLPMVRLRLAEVRREGATVDLRTTGTFTAPGLEGTVRSTLVLRIARPARSEEPGRRDATEERERAQVRVSEWRVASIAGTMGFEGRGVGTETQCSILDACSLAVAGTIVPRPARSSITIVRARGPRDRGDFALFGIGAWEDEGTLTTTAARLDGSAPCTDESRLPAGGLTFEQFPGRGIDVHYDPLGAAGRCPGPLLEADVFGGAVHARGTLPEGAFDGTRRVTIRLTRGIDRFRDGFRVATDPDLTIVLARGG